MRKSSRILSILLVACMLISAMVVAVSAAISTAPTKPDGATGSITKTDTLFGYVGNASNSGYKCFAIADGGIIKNSDHSGASHGASCPAGGALTNQDKLVNFKYMTFDFDFSAVGYLNEEGKFDANATSGKLSYQEGLNFSAYGGSSISYPAFAYFVYDGANWYISADKVYSEGDIALATEAGARNHFTLVDTGSQLWIYIDGEYVSSFNSSFNKKSNNRIGISPKGIATADSHDYQIKAENIVYNLYSDDYASGSAFGLDDYIAAGDTSAPLYNCADVVYGANYIYDNAVAGQDTVTVQYANKAPVSYQNVAAFNAALANISASDLEGANIVSRRSLLSLALPSGISDITISTVGNAKMTLSKTAAYVIDGVTSDAGLTVYTLKGVNLQELLDASRYNSNIVNLTKYDYDTTEQKFTISGSGLQNALETGVTSFETDMGSNKFVSVHNKATPKATTGNHWPYFFTNTTANGSYFAVDFDIANVYFDSNINNIKLGYFHTSNYDIPLFIVANADRTEFYASINNVLDGDDIMISSSEQVWTHITYIIHDGKAYSFVDGKYLGNNAIKSTTVNRFAIQFDGISATNYDVKCNINFDNIAINNYNSDYTSGDDYGLDDYMAEIGTTDKNLMECVDVVYNVAYMYRLTLERQNAVVIELADGTKKTYGLADVDAGIAAIEALTADELSSAKIFLRKGVLDTDKLAAGADLKIFADGSVDITGGTNYNLRILRSADGIRCYVIDCLTVASEGITNVGVITAGKPIVNDHNNGTIGYGYGNATFSTSGTVGSKQTVVKDGIINDYQQIMNDGSHADVNTGGKFINNNSQIWFGMNKTPLSANKYVTVDFDFASDKYLVDGKLSDTGSELAYVDGMSLNTLIGLRLYIVKNEGAWYVSANETYSQDDIPLASEAGVWNHFTIITTSEGELYAFVDGKYITSVVKAPTTALERILGHTGGSAYTAFSYAFDNVSVNTYALGGDYALDAFLANDTYKTTSLYGVDDIVYNKDYKYYGFVDGQYAATVTDKEGNEKNYFFLEGALENLADGVTIESRKNIPAIDPDDSIESYTIITKLGATMAKPSDKYYKITKSTSGTTTTYVLSRVGEDELVIVNWIIGDKTFDEISDVKGSELTIADEILAEINALVAKTKGTYKWEMNLGDGFAFVDSLIVPETYTSKDPVTVRIAAITVTWLDGAGEVYATESWFAGNEITPYDITGLSNVEITGNGWYNIDYTTWETAGMDMLNNKFIAEALTPMTFTAKKTPIPAVTDVKLNMSLLTKFEANLYITNRPLANITLNGIFSDAELTLDIIADLKLAEVDGKSFYLDNFFFDNSEVDKVVSRFVEYTVVYEGGEITLVDEIQVSLLDYAEKVLAQYACGSKEANLAYNLINYANAAYALKTGADYDAAVAFLALEGHEEGCACAAKYAYAPEEVRFEENTLGENVVGWSFDVSNEQPAFVVYVKVDEFDNALVEDIELAFFGINGTEVTDVAVKLVRGENVEVGEDVYATYFFEDMPLYNAAEIFTLTVTDATTGEVCVANYSLATYIDFAVAAELDAASLKVAEALYSFAKVAKDYKLN